MTQGLAVTEFLGQLKRSINIVELLGRWLALMFSNGEGD